MKLEQEKNECKGWAVGKRNLFFGYMQSMCVYVGNNSARFLPTCRRPQVLIAEMSRQLQISFGPFILLPMTIKPLGLGATAAGQF